MTASMLAECSPAKKEAHIKLPPATMEGANTFGCEFNGAAWMPQNNDKALGSNLEFFYDKREGLTIKAIKVKDNVEEFIYITIGDCGGTGIYSTALNNVAVAYTNYRKAADCVSLFSRNPKVQATGTVRITRLDEAAGIVSGVFDLQLSKEGCEEVILKEGRFDGKL